MSPYFGLTLLFDCWTFVWSSSDDDRARVGVGGVNWVSRAGHVTPPPLLWVESRNWSSNIKLSSGEYSRAFLDICLYKIPVQWWWPLSSALASTFPSVLTPNSSAEDLKLNLFSKSFRQKLDIRLYEDFVFSRSPYWHPAAAVRLHRILKVIFDSVNLSIKSSEETSRLFQET